MVELAYLQLIYTSRATRDVSKPVLLRMLKEYRQRNLSNGITGQLLFKDGYFIQVLEGKDTQVNQLFDKIALDRRHENVRKLSSITVDKRSYPKWSMGFSNLQDNDSQDITDYFDEVVDPSESAQSKLLVKLLDYFRTH